MGDLTTMAMAMLRRSGDATTPTTDAPRALLATVIRRDGARVLAFTRAWLAASRDGSARPSLSTDAEAMADRAILARMRSPDEPPSDPTLLRTKLGAIRRNMLAANAAANIPTHRPEVRLIEDDTGTVRGQTRLLLPPPAVHRALPASTAYPPDIVRDRWGYVDGNPARLQRRPWGDGPPGSRVWNQVPLPSLPIPRRGRGPYWLPRPVSTDASDVRSPAAPEVVDRHDVDEDSVTDV